MRESTTKEKILKRIRKGLIHKTANPFPGLEGDERLFPEPNDSMEILFAQNFIDAGGHFIFCENELEFVDSCISLASENKWKSILCIEPDLQNLFDDCEFPYLKSAGQNHNHQASVTSCEFLLARTGTVMISSAHSGRRTAAFSPVHIIIAYTSQLVFDMKDAFIGMKERYPERMPSMLSMITGPSATADIENKIINGAHGPLEIYVFMINDIAH
jgi:L-lactate dehydrogenase complex protein LldG